MNILVVCQHFYPESFRINDICTELIKRGHKVSVLTGMPNYPAGVVFDGYEECYKTPRDYNGVTVYNTDICPRGNSKKQLILNYFSFWFKGCKKAKKLAKAEKFDCVFVYQLSPVFMAFPGITVSKKQKIPMYTYVLDLWPESLAEMTGIKSGPVFSYIKHLTKKVYKASEKILISSESFKNSITDAGIDSDKVMFWPQYAEDFYKPVKVPEEDSIKEEIPTGFNIIYTGNFGEAQKLETAIEAAALTKKEYPGMNWIFMGGGRDEANIRKKAEELGVLDKNVFFIGRKPAEEVCKYLSVCDAALLILKDMPLLNITLPAKIQSYFACGIPVIASCSGEGAEIVKKSGAGLSCPAENPKILAETAISMYNMKDSERNSMKENSLSYFEKNYRKEFLMDILEEVIG
ncbi:MAG: glycosyltransferase family 4 protein [Clostridia bacterium]|nr:glycosyltransferase family 4 protein [Clostridia bacterium]MBQ8165087.1 glycosyltransferase family 4 protein [Clostridia bacterium]